MQIFPPWSELLDLAQTAPSGDNCQPWIFSTQGNHLRITLDENLGAHFLNRNHHASLISLGCVLEVLRIAGAHRGWKYERGQFERNTLSVELHFSQTVAEPQELDEFIKRRYTYRGSFQQGSSMPLNELASEFSSKESKIRILPEIKNDYKKLMSSYDSLHWRYDPLRVDLLKWIHLSEDEWRRSQDGFSLREVGLSGLDVPPLSLMKKAKWVRDLLWRPSAWKAGMLYKQWLKNNLGVAFFVSETATISDESFLEVGSSAYRFWLKCQQNGLAVQPLTNISLGTWEILNGFSPLNSEEQSSGRRIYQYLQKELGLTEDQKILWALRVGVPAQEMERISLRRPIRATNKT